MAEEEALNTVVKGHHAKLRERLKELGEEAWEQVWAENLADASGLTKYADAMRSLATEEWRANEDRVVWCHEKILDYFHRGQLAVVLAKDERRRQHEMERAKQARLELASEDAQPATGSPLVESVAQVAGEQAPEATVVQPGTRSDSVDLAAPASGKQEQDPAVAHEPSLEAKVDENVAQKNAPSESKKRTHDQVEESSLSGGEPPLSVPPFGQLAVLDVGSCFNPFARFPDLQVTAVDIAPAVPTVLRCDFSSSTLCVANQHLCAAGHCESALSTQSFHAIIFCLLLSYMPSGELRLQCCLNARRALKQHGLLLIVSPDSNHVGKGAVWMKSWKACLEQIGFSRWRYEKLPHLHCMAFRAVGDVPLITQERRRELAQLMIIPQDSNHPDQAQSKKGRKKKE
eukprot:m.105179 g.105179  ORF g.105179 m.105179 type:complete len:402 (-) comp14194_c2_seq1:86-1291(-)